jgi:2-polyprenyl-3-methyl-5-hydroxy-6-metoxy-1,4-benzoquinol methylase
MRRDGAPVCRLCGGPVRFAFADRSHGERFVSFHCRRCALYQTLGAVAAISPDYVDLAPDDLHGTHVFLQREHKHRAFRQWRGLVRTRDTGFAAGETRNVLDIGCGIGGFLDFAAGEGCRTFGFDASAAQAGVARAAHPNVRTASSLEDYAQQLGPLPAFDFVTMWDVFEHVRTPKALLDSLAPHLAPGALLFIAVPGGGLLPLKLVINRLRAGDTGLIPWEHVFYYTPRSLAKMLRRSGFAIVAAGGVVPYVRRWSPAEALRRLAHRLLGRSRFALQIYALARVRTP